MFAHEWVALQQLGNLTTYSSLHGDKQRIRYQHQSCCWDLQTQKRLAVADACACGFIQEGSGCRRLSLSSSSSCTGSDVLQQRRNGSSSHGRYIGSDYGAEAANYERQQHSRCAQQQLRPKVLVGFISHGCEALRQLAMQLKILSVCHAACSSVSNRQQLISSAWPGRLVARCMMHCRQPRGTGSQTHGRPADRVRRTSTAGSHSMQRAAMRTPQLMVAPGDLECACSSWLCASD
jgi:hypothetical protein